MPGVERGEPSDLGRSGQRPEVEGLAGARIEGGECALRRTSVDAVEADQDLRDRRPRGVDGPRGVQPSLDPPEVDADCHQEAAAEARRKGHHAGRRGGQPVRRGDDLTRWPGDHSDARDNRSHTTAGLDTPAARLDETLRYQPRAANRRIVGGLLSGLPQGAGRRERRRCRHHPGTARTQTREQRERRDHGSALHRRILAQDVVRSALKCTGSGA
jgi:hypothetical protein